jgi:hypothetical protein
LFILWPYVIVFTLQLGNSHIEVYY